MFVPGESTMRLWCYSELWKHDDDDDDDTHTHTAKINNSPGIKHSAGL